MIYSTLNCMAIAILINLLTVHLFLYLQITITAKVCS